MARTRKVVFSSACRRGLALMVREEGKGETNLYLSYGKSPRPSSLFPKDKNFLLKIHKPPPKASPD